MRIYLAYVSGINRIDTPMFLTLSEQRNWFNNITGHIYIDTTYYPPHYTNKIRFDITDVDFTSAYNYLWFTFREKTYYYFIDSITYINESIVELDITMDYIQTYMFNITVINGIIERKFINRWYQNPGQSTWLVNRNYLRENVSGGLYEKQEKNYITTGEYVMVLKSTESLSDFESGTDTFKNRFANTFTTYLNSNKVSDSNDDLIVSPYHYTLCFLDNYTTATYGGTTYSLYTDAIYFMIRETAVYDAYIIPIEYFSGMFIISGTAITLLDKGSNKPRGVGSLNIVLSTGVAPAFEWGIVGSEQTPARVGDYNDIKDYDIKYTLSNNLAFVRNTSTGTTFRSMYMPIMYDENYVYLRFGNNDAYIDVPTHYYTSLTLELVSHLDLTNGTITNGVISYGNKLSCYEIDTNIVSCELVNSAWNDYIANNKNRWASAGLKAGASAVDTFVSVATGTAFAKKGIDRVLKDARSYTKKRGKLKSGVQRYITRLKDETIKGDIDDITSGAIGVATPLIAQGIEDSNMQQKPDSPKQSGTFSSLLAQNKRLYYQWFRCRDFEQCANYFHRNGYHVEEYVNNVPIFVHVQNRYYFNILKMSDANIALTGCLSDNETIDGVIDRLFTGVRLWNVKNTGVIMGNFTYDNVELIFLS